YAAARPCCEQALAICKNVLGPEHPNTVEALNHMAALSAALGETKRAWERLTEAAAASASANRKFLATSAERDFACMRAKSRSNFEILLNLPGEHAELMHTGR